MKSWRITKYLGRLDESWNESYHDASFYVHCVRSYLFKKLKQLGIGVDEVAKLQQHIVSHRDGVLAVKTKGSEFGRRTG
jgi:hypothetical protein